MSKSRPDIGAVRPGAFVAPESPTATPIVLSHEEQWSIPDEMQTVEEVVNGMGLQLLGSVDAPSPVPLVVAAPLFAKIQHADREMAVVAARRQELMELAIDLLGVDRALHRAVIDLDTGVVTLAPHEAASSS